jgi:hypothetical protein
MFGDHSSNAFVVQDEVLQGMQQKLDDLMDEMNSLQQQYVKCDSYISTQEENIVSVDSKKFGEKEGSKCCACVRPNPAVAPQKAKV